MSISKIRFNSLKKNTSLNKKTKVHDLDILTIMSPEDVKKYIWGDINKLDKSIRKYLEPAPNQCEKAGISFRENDTLCWLCGCYIDNGDKECEHILPLLHAIMFKGIITTNEIMQRPDYQKANKKLLNEVTKSNYLWAHGICNRKKSGTVLIKLSKDFKELSDNFFIPDKEKCKKLYDNLINTGTGGDDCYKYSYIFRGLDGKNSKEYLNIYRRIVSEMQTQCISINNELKSFRDQDNENYMNNYIEYIINIIKLYANSEALKELIPEKNDKETKKTIYPQPSQWGMFPTKPSYEEESKILIEQESKKNQDDQNEKDFFDFLNKNINDEKVKRLIEEQQILQEKCEKTYTNFLQSLLDYKKESLCYNKYTDVPIQSIIRIHCSNFLSKRIIFGKEIIIPPHDITIISDKVSNYINPIIRDIFENRETFESKPLPISFIYSIIDFLSFCLIYEEAQKNNILFYYNKEKIDTEKKFNKCKCYFLYVLIQKIKDTFYIDLSHEEFIENLNSSDKYNRIKEYFTYLQIDIDICDKDIEKEFDNYIMSIRTTKKRKRSIKKDSYNDRATKKRRIYN